MMVFRGERSEPVPADLEGMQRGIWPIGEHVTEVPATRRAVDFDVPSRERQPVKHPEHFSASVAFLADLVIAGPHSRLNAVPDPDPVEDRGEVRLDGLLADPELAGDQLVREPAGDQPQDLEFAVG
jgi:hypothetical protein